MPDVAHPDGPPLSRALLDYSQPLLRTLDGEAPPPATFLRLVRMASMVWNAALHERLHGSPELVRRVVETIRHAGSPPEAWAAVDRLVATKRHEDPLDARWIADVHLVPRSGDQFDLRVSGAPSSALDVDEIEEIVQASPFPIGRPPRPADRPAQRQSPQPRKSTASPPTDGHGPWRSLYGAAKALHALAPWDDHLDRDVFGIEVEGDPDVYWCSIMGAAGSYFGIALYRGDSGWAAYRYLASTSEGDDAGALGYDGFLVSFVDREETTAAERRRIANSGIRFRGRGAWPQLDRVRRGRLPRSIDEEGAPALGRLLTTLVRALEQRSESGIPEPVDLDGPIPVYRDGPRGLERYDRMPEPVPEPRLPAVDQTAVDRLRSRAAPTDLVVEFDAPVADVRIQAEDGWEFQPTVYMCVAAGSGHLLAAEVGASDERSTDCPRKLLEAFSRHDILPREVHVTREWMRRALDPTLRALGVRLVLRSSLPQTESVATALASRFAP